MPEPEQHTERITELERQVRSLIENQEADRLRLEHIEDFFRTADTPLWKRIVFRLDGWGPWFRIRGEPRWRPWRRWWRS